MDLIQRGRLKPLDISKIFSFQETIEAFRYMQQGKYMGKIVISYEDGKESPLSVCVMILLFSLRIYKTVINLLIVSTTTHNVKPSIRCFVPDLRWFQRSMR